MSPFTPKCQWRATVKDYGELTIPPLCPECNGPVRPDVVLFGVPYDEMQVYLLTFLQLDEQRKSKYHPSNKFRGRWYWVPFNDLEIQYSGLFSWRERSLFWSSIVRLSWKRPIDELHKGFDLYFWVGTTGLFPYIQRPILDAAGPDRYAIEINPGETELSDQMDIKIPLGAAEALGKIWGEYREGR